MADRVARITLTARDLASGKIKGLTTTIGILGATAAAVGVTALGKKLVDGMTAAVEAAGVQEKAEIKLSQAIRLSGDSVDVVLPKLQEQASELQNLTGIGDEVILSQQAILVSMGKLRGEGLERATKAALDLAAANEMDLKAAFDLVAKAAVGYTSTLSRYGIILDEAIPKSEKFEAALSKIEEMFGGQAQAQLFTFEGRVQELHGRLGDLKEVLGEPMREVITETLAVAINPMIAGFTDSAKEADSFRIAVLSLAKDIAEAIVPIEMMVTSIDWEAMEGPVKFFFKPQLDMLKALKKAFEAIRAPQEHFIEPMLRLTPLGESVATAMEAQREAADEYGGVLLETSLYSQMLADRFQELIDKGKQKIVGPEIVPPKVGDLGIAAPSLEPVREESDKIRKELSGMPFDFSLYDATDWEGIIEAAINKISEIQGLESEYHDWLQNEEISLATQRYGAITDAFKGSLKDQYDAQRAALDELNSLEMTALEEKYDREIGYAESIGADTAELEKAKETAITRQKEKATQDRMRLDEMEAKQKQELNNMVAQGIAGLIEEVFGDSKAAAIAAAIINTAQGVTQALANLPPPYSYIMAAITAAMGLAQVAKIRSTRKEKGKGYGGIVQGEIGFDRVTMQATAGEGYLTPQETAAIWGGRAMLVPTAAGIGAGASEPILVVNIHAWDQKDVARALRNNRGAVRDALRDLIRLNEWSGE